LGLISLLLLGCDGIVRVTGSVVSMDGAAPLEDCEAVLYKARNGEVLQTHPISGRFLESFTVYPVKTNFYVEVRCEGYSPFRSDPFYSSGDMSDSTDLGEIRLKPLPEPSTSE
jgi:hypothetical protein